MKAIILCAGRGSRLEPYTSDKPKCALEFLGTKLLDWQSISLNHNGVEEIEVVTGYARENLKLGHRKTWVNKAWSKTNMVYSLLSARESL